MKIRWYGHSCFYMVNDRGLRLVTDPFDESVGYPEPNLKADIVTVSHKHHDHNNTSPIRGRFFTVDCKGSFSFEGLRVEGILTYHDNVKGEKRGNNIMHIIETEGLRICHCGDLGHELDSVTLREMGKIDILLIPVGGVYTIDAKQALNVMRAVRPAVTIPMHYQTEVVKFPIAPVEEFLELCEKEKIQYHIPDTNEIMVQKGQLNEHAPVTVLNYQ